MKIRFNKFEKVAGLFVLGAGLSFVVAAVGIAIKNGWLTRKVAYHTHIETADGVHAGTVVQIAGLRVGSVTAVELQSDDRVRVQFEIFEQFKEKVRKDSQIRMFRPFILAEKVLEIQSGSSSEPVQEVGAMIPSLPSTDLMDLLSGKKMSEVFSSFDHLAESIKVMGNAFANPERTRALVQLVDNLSPLVQNMNTMATEIVKITNVANKQKRAEIIVSSLTTISEQLQKIVPEFTGEAPHVGAQLGQIVTNLNVLTTEFKKLTPAISVLAPELPRTSRKAVEALDETVVLLKALQKSFLLRGNVKEVRDEEIRRPANTSEP